MSGLRRWMGLTIGAVAVLSAGVWLAVGVLIRPGSAPLRPSAAPGASTQVVAGSLEDLLMELQLVPMEGQMPKAFDLPSLEGRRVALADLAGRPTLLYFWATW